jgi:hypothetical protein
MYALYRVYLNHYESIQTTSNTTLNSHDEWKSSVDDDEKPTNAIRGCKQILNPSLTPQKIERESP